MLVVERGSRGPVVLLLNGIGTPLEHLERLADSLADSYRVVVPVFPGYRGTTRGRSAASLEADAASVREVVETRIGATIHAAVGVSFGFYRAATLATSGRIVVSRVVGISPTLRFAANERNVMNVLADGIERREAPVDVLAQRALSPSHRAVHRDGEDELARWLDDVDPDTLAAELRMASRMPDFDPSRLLDASKLTLRVGDADAVTPATRVASLAGLKVRIQVVAGAGHLLLLEDFVGTAHAVASALAESAGRREPVVRDASAV